MMGVRGLVAVAAGAGLLAACSTAEPYGGERFLVHQGRAGLPARGDDPVFRVGPDGPMMSARQLEQEKMRRMRARVHVNPGLVGVVDRYGLDGDYGDVLRR